MTEVTVWANDSLWDRIGDLIPTLAIQICPNDVAAGGYNGALRIPL